MRVEGGRLVRRSSRVSHADARRTWTEREGIVLELRADGRSGFGEASPLPGYSRDDLATCELELERCWEMPFAIDVDAPILETLRGAVSAAAVRAPAAVFALETAVLDLVSKARRQPAWAVLRGDAQAAPIPLSAIAEGGTAEELASAAEQACARGIRVVKVKVGGADCTTRDPPRLAAVRARIGDAFGLRLDANQALPLADLQRALAALAAFGPELIEEPAPPDSALALLETPIPLAMDESLMLDGWAARILTAATRGTYAAVVLKPMSLGGFDHCLAIAAAARAARLGVIVTHVFDGPIGSAAAACLALAIPGEVLACGLDAHGRLEQPIAAIGPTHIFPFASDGLGVDGLA